MGIDEMNQLAGKVMEEWDPFSNGSSKYEPEIIAVIAQLQVIDDPSSLAKQIRNIYRVSCGLWIPLEKCVAVSYKLLALKFEAKSIL